MVVANSLSQYSVVVVGWVELNLNPLAIGGHSTPVLDIEDVDPALSKNWVGEDAFIDESFQKLPLCEGPLVPFWNVQHIAERGYDDSPVRKPLVICEKTTRAILAYGCCQLGCQFFCGVKIPPLQSLGRDGPNFSCHCFLLARISRAGLVLMLCKALPWLIILYHILHKMSKKLDIFFYIVYNIIINWKK